MVLNFNMAFLGNGENRIVKQLNEWFPQTDRWNHQHTHAQTHMYITDMRKHAYMEIHTYSLTKYLYLTCM